MFNKILVVFCLSFLVSPICMTHTHHWPKLSGDTASIRKVSSKKGDFVVPHLIQKIKLDDVSFYVKGGSQPDVEMRFSPDGKLIAIGTFLGQLKVINIYTGKILLDKKTAEGMVKHIDFSPDGKTIYYGEQSVDGFITAMTIQTGKILWQYRLADDLETSPPPAKENLWGIYSLPGCYRLKVLADGDLLVLGIHSWGSIRDLNGMTRWSRLYRFTKNGKRKWAFPSKGPMAMSLIYFDSDEKARRVAILAGNIGINAPADYRWQKGSLYVLNGYDGSLVGSHHFTPLKPYFRYVGFWQSVSVNQKGTSASVGMRDGRSFIFDLDEVKPKKVFRFGAPILISNIPVSAMATYTHMANDGRTYFQTGNSSIPNTNTMNDVIVPPGPHPNANMINVIDQKGRIKWRYKSGHSYENFWSSKDGRWILTTVKRKRQNNRREFGVLLFDTHRPGGGSSKLVYYYQVEGLSFFQADIARDGSAIALAEIPYISPDTGKLVGTYQVHIVR